MTAKGGPAGQAARTADAPANPFAAGFAALAGAPLDFIKIAAAFFMVLDHTNTILLNRGEAWLFRFGRIAFPLFCFAVAAHVVRDRDTRGKSLAMLLVFAALTQVIYSWAFNSAAWGNVLFTLAAGSAVAVFLVGQNLAVRHGLLALALIVSWWEPTLANGPADYGVPGMLFPAAIALTAIGGASYVPWVIAYGYSVNAFQFGYAAPGWWADPAITGSFAVLGSAAVIAVSRVFIGRPRFLPRYALHFFYPGHIGLLGALRALTGMH